MAKVRNIVIEKYDDGRAAILDQSGVVREVPDLGYEIGQCLFVDVEAIDLSCAIMSSEGTKRAMAGDYNTYMPKTGIKTVVAKHVFPIAASFALALIFGVGGGVYASGEVSKTVEADGVSYDMNYFDRVIGVHIDEVNDEDLSELKREIHGKTLDDAQSVIKEKRNEKLSVPQTKVTKKDQEPDGSEDSTQKDDEEPVIKPERITGTEPEEDDLPPQDNMERHPEAMDEKASTEPEKNERMKQQKGTQDAPSEDLRQQSDMEGKDKDRYPEEKPGGQKDIPEDRQNDMQNGAKKDMQNDGQNVEKKDLPNDGQEGTDENIPQRDAGENVRPEEGIMPQNGGPEGHDLLPER